jgi:hypothetical protein
MIPSKQKEGCVHESLLYYMHFHYRPSCYTTAVGNVDRLPPSLKYYNNMGLMLTAAGMHAVGVESRG